MIPDWVPRPPYEAPLLTWHGEEPGLQVLSYTSGPGTVPALLATPETTGTGDGPLPAVLLLHGGGGRSFPEWARTWADRGYAALALDLSGEPQAGGGGAFGVRLTDENIFDAVAGGVAGTWLPRAVRACVDAVTLLTGLDGVDPGRIGVAGISWGGYLAALHASADPRVRCAAVVYAAGLLREHGHWVPRLRAMPPGDAAVWERELDLTRHAGRIAVPTLWVTGTEDPCFPLEAFASTLDLLPSAPDIRIVPGLEHSHPAGWGIAETPAFLDAVLRGRPSLPALDGALIHQGVISARLRGEITIESCALHHTTGRESRDWQVVPAHRDDRTVSAHLPENATAAFLSAVDSRGLTATSGVSRGGEAVPW
ncbi:alpha/beta hydrolase family protein [Rhizohabitans arisaemae]|uniref:alpha/beta hydrolase family protein n=1 Tax=Rhizohabitans arisaemae TaxID=2720610 RepID=UPI0024B2468A|nr:dienelactone hydrolase family protein [Rhizohabitans arisaemae]